MRKAWMGLFCGLLLGWGLPAAAAEVPIEGSMQVTGTLAVDASGAVAGYTLDRSEKLPPPVVELLGKTLPTFRFQVVPKDGEPQPVHAKMTLQVIARQIDAKHAAIALHSARFVEVGADGAPEDSPATDKIYIARRASMEYPAEALRVGLSGTVYVALRIDRTGHVVDAQAQQVNLRSTDSEAHMVRWREVLARPTLERVRRFTFQVPTTGPHAGDAYFSGVLPVNYHFDDQRLPGYGEWDSYVPGPKQDIAWLDPEQRGEADNSEAVRDGEFALAGSGLKLLTPLNGG